MENENFKSNYFKLNSNVDKYNCKSAIEILNDAILKTPNDPDLYRERGRAKYFQKYYFVENNPKKGFSAIYSNDFGKMYGNEKYQDVIDDYNMALELNPNDALCYLYMADTMNTIEDKNLCFDAAIQVNPNFIDAYDKKIGENIDFRRFPIAIEAMKLMIKNNPKNKQAKNLFSSYKYFLGKTYETYENYYDKS